MVKSQKQLFDIDNDNEEEIISKTKNKKSKKPLSDTDKQALIERLKAGKEKKRLERESKGNSQAQNKAVNEDTIEKSVIKNNPSPAIDPRDLEIKELKNMIKETKNKLEMQALKDELKELRNLIKEEKKEEKKQENLKIQLNTIPEEEKPLLPISKPAPPPQPKQIRRLKKQFR